MSDDLVKLLQEWDGKQKAWETMKDAAAEIERLRNENASLRETIEWNNRTSDLDFMGGKSTSQSDT